MGAERVIVHHRLSVRICHWVNAIAFVFLLVSGIGIILYHPEFYWGEAGYFGLEAWLTLPLEPDKGQTSWGRNIHFLFAWIFVVNGLFYVVSGLLNGHFRRKVLPTREQLRLQHVLSEISTHVRFRRPRLEDLATYNVLQKMIYIVVIFVIGPVLLLSGMTMSPGFVAALPELTDLFGGRQSARSVHFICANILTLFLIVHLIEVVLAGTGRMIRSMITGSFGFSQEQK